MFLACCLNDTDIWNIKTGNYSLAGVAAQGSVEKVFSGYYYYYYRCMRLLKESFDALVNYRVVQVYGCVLLQGLHLRSKIPDSHNLKSPLRLINFEHILQVRGEQDGMTIAFLRDITALLSLLAAVRKVFLNRKKYPKTHIFSVSICKQREIY